MNEECIFSLDIKSMYTNLPTAEIYEYIISELYKDPKSYFEPQIKSDGTVIEFPDKKKFSRLLHAVLIKYTAFSTKDKFFIQRSGCSMGSSLKPVVSNIFMNKIEETIFR